MPQATLTAEELPLPVVQGVDPTPLLIFLAVALVLGLIGYVATLVRIGRDNDKPWRSSVVATGGVLGWFALSYLIGSNLVEADARERVEAARPEAASVLAAWGDDERAAAGYGGPGLEAGEIDRLVATMDLTRSPVGDDVIVGHVWRAVSPGERVSFELMWNDESGYFYRLNTDSAPLLQAKVNSSKLAAAAAAPTG